MTSPKTHKKHAASPALPTLAPDIRLFGNVDQAMLSEFFRQQAEAKPGGALVLELSTSGGNADIGRAHFGDRDR